MSVVVNFEALKQKAQDAAKSDDLYFRFDSKTDGKTFNVRIPLWKEPDTSYFRKVSKLWLGKKTFLSLLTFGETYCPMVFGLREAINTMKTLEVNGEDPKELERLKSILMVKGYNNKPTLLRLQHEYMIPCFLETGDGDETKWEPKILQCSNNLFQSISDLVTNGEIATKVDKKAGFFSIENGESLSITRNGIDKNTKYTVAGSRNSVAIPKEVMKTLPDLRSLLDKQRKEPEFLENLIQNFVDTGEVLEDAEKEEDSPINKIKKK